MEGWNLLHAHFKEQTKASIMRETRDKKHSQKQNCRFSLLNQVKALRLLRLLRLFALICYLRRLQMSVLTLGSGLVVGFGFALGAAFFQNFWALQVLTVARIVFA